MGKNIAIIDIESQGSNTSYSSIISIAGILVNPELEVLSFIWVLVMVEEIIINNGVVVEVVEP